MVKSVCCDHEEVIEIWWLNGIENFVREMILYSIRSETLAIVWQSQSQSQSHFTADDSYHE